MFLTLIASVHLICTEAAAELLEKPFLCVQKYKAWKKGQVGFYAHVERYNQGLVCERMVQVMYFSIILHVAAKLTVGSDNSITALVWQF